MSTVARTRPGVPAALWALAAFVAGTLHAQELEPRAYAQTPTGVNFIAVGYGFSTGDQYAWGGKG